MSERKSIKHIDFNTISKNMFIISIPLIFIIFTVINPNFASWYNIKNLLYSMCPILVLSGGLTFVLLLGGIDLSTGALCSCVCVLTGLNIVNYGNKFIILMVLFGIVAGLVNGVLVSVLKMPSFIVTLCTQSIWNCIALVLSDGSSSSIGAADRAVIEWTKIEFLGLPIIFWLSILLFVMMIFFQNKTAIGKAVFAVGSNADAARMSGVNVPLVQIMAFTICGVASAITGVWYALIMKGSVPTIGTNLGLMGIASVAIGGTSLAGGSGSVVRTIFGCTIIVMIRTGLNVIGVDAYWQDIIYGLIVVLALCLNTDRSLTNRVVK